MLKNQKDEPRVIRPGTVFQVVGRVYNFKKLFAVRTCGQQRCHNKASKANGAFEDDPFSKTVEEFLRWIDSEMAFLKKQNERIANVN